MTDLDELVTTERFKEIHDARKQVIEDERQINHARAQGGLTESSAIRHYQRSVKGFVRELETLLNPIDGDPNAHWVETEVGVVSLPNGDRQVVEGLGDFLEVPENIAVEIQIEASDAYYEIANQKTKTVHTQPDWDLIESAFRLANHALADVNMDIDPEESSSSVWEFREIEDVDDIDPDEWTDITFNKSDTEDDNE